MLLLFTKKGFTLIELLLAIGIIAILASIIIVAINPNKQLGEARNAQRHADINTILSAVYQYSIDNDGRLPSDIETVEIEICKSGVNIDCTTLVNLNVLTGAYLVSLPSDPRVATSLSTKYTIFKSGNRVTVKAPFAELNALISVTR